MRENSQELNNKEKKYSEGAIFTERILFGGCAMRFLKTSYSIQSKVEYAITLLKEMEKGGMNAEYIQNIFEIGKSVWSSTSTIQEDFLAFLLEAKCLGEIKYGDEGYLRLTGFINDMRETLADFTMIGKEKREKYNHTKANFAICVSKMPQLKKVVEVVSHKALYCDYPLTLEEVKKEKGLRMLLGIIKEQNSLIEKALLELKDIEGITKNEEERREA